MIMANVDAQQASCALLCAAAFAIALARVHILSVRFDNVA